MSCMNAFVHDLHHCTKLQLSTRCSFGVMTQTRHKLEWEKWICTIVRAKKPNLHCVFLTVISVGPQMKLAVLAV